MSIEEEKEPTEEEIEKILEDFEDILWKIDLEDNLKQSSKDLENLAKVERPESVRQRKIYYFEIFPDYLWKRVNRTVIDHDIKQMLRINVECVKNEPRKQQS